MTHMRKTEDHRAMDESKEPECWVCGDVAPEDRGRWSTCGHHRCNKPLRDATSKPCTKCATGLVPVEQPAQICDPCRFETP